MTLARLAVHHLAVRVISAVVVLTAPLCGRGYPSLPRIPKMKDGRRVVSLPPIALDSVCRLALRMALVQGKPEPDALVFSDFNDSPIAPNNLSRDWRRFVLAHKLPRISFHDLRHCHVSALIAGGVDALTVSRRIGHASPVVTMKVYAHLFSGTDSAVAKAIEAARRTGKERRSRYPVAIRWNSGFQSPDRRAKSLINNCGAVAEWLKAAVC
jgi:Phage integrase family